MSDAAFESRSASLAVDFLARVRMTPDAEAYRFPVPVPDGGGREEWRSLTWAEAAARVRAVSAGLVALGVEPQDRVAIIGETRVDWILVDFGIMCAGAATATVYPSTNADETAFILEDSGSRVVVAENARQIDKLLAERGRLGGVEKVVVIDGVPDELAGDDWFLDLGALELLGAERLAAEPGTVEQRVAGIEPTDLATLIYTSGTTGRPKGVRLSHDTWVYHAAVQTEIHPTVEGDLQYLWLPLAHCFGKVMLSGQIRLGYPVAVDGRVPMLVVNLPVVRPTLMAAAPRVFEKVHNAVTVRMKAEGGLKYRMFTWAVGVGRRMSRARQAGRTPSPLLRAENAIADRLVFVKIRALFGGRLRACISGSAALSYNVAEFFDAVGVPIYEGYGLTESSAGTCVNREGANRLGTVGPPLPGTEVRIADDGEVLLRARSLMSGYHNHPELTAETIDDDGWLHTGDIGELDADGYLRITDRKKDLIKTSGGKYVSPSDIEGRFKGMCPYVSNIVVHGNNRNYCSALITLDDEVLRGWAGPEAADVPYAELVARADVRSLVEGYVTQLNGELQRWQTVKRFEILPRDLSVGNGELTPSLKVKRAVVEREYAALLEGMYGDTLVS